MSSGTTPVTQQLETFLSLTSRRQTVIASNMANSNTVGYSRQVVSLSAESLNSGADGGVSFKGYTSVRDQILNIAVNNKTSDQASLDTQSSALAAVQTAFSGTTTGVGAAMSTFFAAVSSLSTNPTDSSARQSVLSAAGQLADAFHQGASALTGAQAAADTQVTATVAQINQLSARIAQLNGAIGQAQSSQGGGQTSGSGGALQDQRDLLTSQLAQLTGISETQTDGQPTLTTANGSALVVGDHAYALQVSTGPDGLKRVLNASGNDVTASLSGGTLGGALQTRDTTVPGMLGQLNTLATQFASAVNSAQAAGYDSTGAVAQPMFAISGANASAGLSVALVSGAGVAASSDGSAGSSGNLVNLLGVQSSALPSGATPSDTYASLVTSIGTTAATASASLTATKLSLQQLTSQQSSVSGVSVDEETTNLVKYQQAYTAAAHVISTLNDLFSVVMNMTGAS